MTDIVTTSWSETDASNNQFPPEGWPAGMFPNAVEPAARMNMGALKRFWNRANPVYAAVLSTTDTYTVTPAQAIAGYGLFERWRVRFPSPNTATSPTLSISSFPPQVFQKYTSGVLGNLAAGDIQAQDHEFWWNGINLILINPTPSTGLVSISNTSNGGLLFNTVANAVVAKFQPSNLPVKAAFTSSDSLVISDALATNVPKTGLVSALQNQDANIGYQNIPQNSRSANYTTTAADGGKHIYHPTADSTARTWTIDANATVPYIIGTAITFVNDSSAGIVSITVATADTLVFAGLGSTGTRSLAANGQATALKIGATRWQISGTNLT